MATSSAAARINAPTSWSRSWRASPAIPPGSIDRRATASSSGCIAPCSTSIHGSGPHRLARDRGRMQTALDAFLLRYNHKPLHQGRGMNGRTPWQVFRDGLPVKPEPDQEDPPSPWPPEPNHLARSGHCQLYSVTARAATSKETSVHATSKQPISATYLPRLRKRHRQICMPH